MSLQYFNRYQYFEDEGSFEIIPGIDLTIKPTDKYIPFIKNKDRLDKISQEYYGTPLCGWLIMIANPLSGSVEFDIPDNFILRIPYPLTESLQDYKRSIDLYKLYYGK